MSDVPSPPRAPTVAPAETVAFPRGPLAIPPLGPPLGPPPTVIWRVPGSKSITNRALVLAALADGRSVLTGAQTDGDDTRRMQEALRALGIGVQITGPDTLTVDGGVARLRAPGAPLEVGNSGTTVRFLAALAPLVPGSVILRGDAAMALRPMGDLVDALNALGVAVDCPTGCPPLTVQGGRLPGGRIRLRADRSSQYLSALLMSAAAARSDLIIDLDGPPVSRPYVELTRHMVAAWGGHIDVQPEGFVARAVGAYRPMLFPVEPDASAASYAFAAAVASGGRVTVPGLGTGALQGDTAFLDLLQRAGARVERDVEGSTVMAGPTLRGIEADMGDISDTTMTLAALAPLALGPTTIRNVGHIRIKETDRLGATVEALLALGQQVTAGDDWLRIEPRPVTPALVRCHGDHRMAMSFAVLGLARAGVSIDDPACVAKTYPGFWRDLGSLYEAAGVRRPF